MAPAKNGPIVDAAPIVIINMPTPTLTFDSGTISRQVEFIVPPNPPLKIPAAKRITTAVPYEFLENTEN